MKNFTVANSGAAPWYDGGGVRSTGNLTLSGMTLRNHNYYFSGGGGGLSVSGGTATWPTARMPMTATACANVSNVNGLDQRGVSRPQGAVCDMGAFESKGFSFAGVEPDRANRSDGLVWLSPDAAQGLEQSIK